MGDFEGPLWMLLGTTGIVLLIACANIANLLLGRAGSRRRDLAVRSALGASRGGLIRSQMAEALLIAALGGVGGTLLAWVGVPLLVGAAPESIPRLGTVRVDGTALLLTAGVVILAACDSGLLPAIRFSKPALQSALRNSSRVGAGPNRLTRDVLVVLQTAAALVLLVASGLLLEIYVALSRVDPEYETEDLFTFQMAPDEEHGLTDPSSFAQFHYTVATWSKDQRETLRRPADELDLTHGFFRNFRRSAELRLNTGMRRNESYAASWEKINGQIRTIRITHQVHKNRPELVPLKDRQARVALILPGWWPHHVNGQRGLLLPDRQGRLVHPDRYWELREELLDAAGLNGPGIGYHVDRHTYARDFIIRGGRFEELQKSLGHDSISTTEKAYGHFHEDDAAASARRRIYEDG